jgi:hypothetical protein
MENLTTTSNLKNSENRIEFMDFLLGLFQNSEKEKEMNEYHKQFKKHNEEQDNKFRELKTPEVELPNQEMSIKISDDSILTQSINTDPKIKEV